MDISAHSLCAGATNAGEVIRVIKFSRAKSQAHQLATLVLASFSTSAEDPKDLQSIEASSQLRAYEVCATAIVAEPNLRWPRKTGIAGKHISYGVVFTNGIKRLSAGIDYWVHVSMWGNPGRSRQLRGADIMTVQIKNYRGDHLAVFVFTLTARNLDDIPYITDVCADNGLALAFNHYSLRPSTGILSAAAPVPINITSPVLPQIHYYGSEDHIATGGVALHFADAAGASHANPLGRV